MARVKRKDASRSIKKSKIGKKKNVKSTKKKLREQLEAASKDNQLSVVDAVVTVTLPPVPLTSIARSATSDTKGTKRRSKNAAISSKEIKKRRRKKKIKAASVSKDDEKNLDSKSLPVSTETDTGTTTSILGMEEWEELHTPQPVIRALSDLGFKQPTAIQKEAIPVTIQEQCDIIGAAETGSGKTLAFGIPILHYILSCGQHSGRTEHAQSVESSCSEDTRKRKREKVVHISESKADSDGIIDLNEVLHVYPMEKNFKESNDANRLEVMEVEKATEVEELADLTSNDEGDNLEDDFETPGDESLLDSEAGEVDLVEENDDVSDAEIELLETQKRKRLDRDRKSKKSQKGFGLVAYRDDIPEEEFQKMLSGEILPWEIDEDDEGDDEGGGNTKGKSLSDGRGSCDIKDTSCDHHDNNKLVALILTPTRELALQVQSHINAVAKFTNIKVCAIVGGMATEKQERILRQRPPIVVATPGRLWKLMSEGDPHLTSLDGLKFLVLDEADRMVEFGHFKELTSILERVNGAKSRLSRQTLVYSATLTVQRRTTERKRKKKTVSSQENIDNLMQRAGLKDDARIVDLTKSKVIVETLTETKIMCTNEEKDVYLYYFLLLYPGRTLVFVNSIDCLQKLRSTLELLKLHPLPLHAHMQQRQRLKNVDRFVSNPSGLLVASDVAARGLDFPQVDHIIHYQVPRNTELYVHRSGRTARASSEGLSVMLVGPEDLKAYRNICRTLSKDEELPNFPVDSTYLRAIRQRVSLARQINVIEHRRHKAKTREQWLTQSAKALDIELDDDLLKVQPVNKKDESKLYDLKAQLAGLLQTAVVPQSVSMKFPTRDENHKTVLAKMQSGKSRSHQGGDVVVARQQDALSVAKKK